MNTLPEVARGGPATARGRLGRKTICRTPQDASDPWSASSHINSARGFSPIATRSSPRKMSSAIPCQPLGRPT